MQPDDPSTSTVTSTPTPAQPVDNSIPAQITTARRPKPTIDRSSESWQFEHEVKVIVDELNAVDGYSRGAYVVVDGHVVRIDKKTLDYQRVTEKSKKFAADLALAVKLWSKPGPKAIFHTEAERGMLIEELSHRLPQREGIYCHPVLLDGELHVAGDTERVFVACPQLPPVSDAKKLIEESLSSWQFVDESDFLSAVAFGLTLATKPGIKGPVPIFGFSGPSGSGKSSLPNAWVKAFRSTIRRVPGNSDRTYKIEAAVAEAPDVIGLDNMTPTGLEDETLKSYSTTEPGEKVVAGPARQERVAVPWRSILIATGLRFELGSETDRRAILCRMNARPGSGVGQRRVLAEEDTNQNMTNMFARDRLKILSALVAIVQNWLDVGSPKARFNLPGFPDWSGIVGSIVCHAWPEKAHAWLNPGTENLAPTDLDHALKVLVEKWPRRVERVNGEKVGFSEFVKVARVVKMISDLALGDHLLDPNAKGGPRGTGQHSTYLRALASNVRHNGRTLRLAKDGEGALCWFDGKLPAVLDEHLL